MLDLDNLNKTKLEQKLDASLAEVEDLKERSELQQLAHDLQTHQIELEMQNRELREMQTELEESRDRYADLYDFAPVGYLSLDERGIIHEINLAGATLLGQVRTRIVEQPFLKWIAKNDTSRFFHHLRTVFQSETKISDEFKITGNNGQLLDLHIESIRSTDVLRKTYLCRSVILDVTEMNRIKQETFLRERQLTLITDALPVSIAYINQKEQHLFANKTYADWFGFLPQQIKDTQALDVWGEAVHKKLDKFLRVALAGESVNIETELTLEKANKKNVDVIFIPDSDGRHQVSGVVVLLRDITDRLALEAVDRKRLLESAHISRLVSMGGMVSEIAHEINQPLTVISIYSDACRRMLVSGKGDRNKIIQSLTDISGEAERAGAVIRRIREFASKKDLQAKKTAINELVRQTLQLLAVEVRLHKARLSLKLADNLPPAMADKILIEQVIFNLARNALEAMDDTEESRRLLCIHTSMVKLNEVQFSIEDAGPGLSAEQTEQIFIPFNTTKEKGMGMGLAISQSIIKAHNGRLWVVKNSHGGSTFSFTLPSIMEGDGYAT